MSDNFGNDPEKSLDWSKNLSESIDQLYSEQPPVSDRQLETAQNLSEETIKKMQKFRHSFIIEYEKDGEEFVDDVYFRAGEPIDHKSLETKYGASYKISEPIFEPSDLHYRLLNIQDEIEQRKVQKKIAQETVQQNPPVSDRQLDTAQKTGYVQGVCESILAFNTDENRKIMSEATITFLSKKLLSEMNVTKDMAQKFAHPETYKALEKCVFAPKQEQQLEQTQVQGMKI